MTTVITRTVARLVVPIILVVSVALFSQGHNLPGGGFIAGVLTAAAFALIAVTYSLAYVREEVFGGEPGEDAEDPARGLVGTATLLLGAGLAVGAGSGLVPMFAPELVRGEDAFLSQTFWILHDVPIYGELEVATAVAFDLGVYLTVVGSLLAILTVVGAE